MCVNFSQKTCWIIEETSCCTNLSLGAIMYLVANLHPVLLKKDLNYVFESKFTLPFVGFLKMTFFILNIHLPYMERIRPKYSIWQSRNLLT